MFAETDAVPLFPTYLWMHQLSAADTARVNGNIKSSLTNIRTSIGGEIPRQWWQTEQDLHTLPEFQELNQYILGAAKGIM